MFSTFKDPSNSFVVFTDITYGEVVEKDYQTMYTQCYRENKIKDMVKQILSDAAFHIPLSLKR